MSIELTRKKGDIISIKIFDVNKNVCYKDRANIIDKKEIARIFLNLQQKFGMDIARLIREYINDLRIKEDTFSWN